MEIIVDGKTVNVLTGNGGVTPNDVKEMVAFSDCFAKVKPVVRVYAVDETGKPRPSKGNITVEFPRYFDDVDFSDVLSSVEFQVVLMHYRTIRGRRGDIDHAVCRRGWGMACGSSLDGRYDNTDKYKPFVKPIDNRGSVVFPYTELCEYIVQRFAYWYNGEGHNWYRYDEDTTYAEFVKKGSISRFGCRRVPSKKFGLAFRHRDSYGQWRYSQVKELRVVLGQGAIGIRIG